MDQKEFNRGMDGYLGKVRKLEGEKRGFPDISSLFGKRERKFKDVEINETETVIVEEEQGFLSKIIDVFNPKRSSVEEIGEMEEESEDIEISVKEGEGLEELEEDIEAIERIEKQERSRVGKLRRILGKLKFMKMLRASEEDDLNDDVEIAELKKEETVNDIQTLIDFSVGLLQKLPTKAFSDIKKNKDFREYKDIVKKYVKEKKDTSEIEEIQKEKVLYDKEEQVLSKKEEVSEEKEMGEKKD